LYLMIHGKMHYWEKMMWLIDIVKLSEKMTEEELQACFSIAKENKLDNLFLGTFALCNTAFETPLPSFINDKISNKHAAYVMQGLKSLAGKKSSKISEWKQRVFMKADLKFFLYQISLFPARDMNIIKVPFGKRILYPLLRPITYLLSKK